MNARVPDDVRELLAEHRAAEEARLRQERKAARKQRAAERKHQRDNERIARALLAFARDLASEGLVPPEGVEIFRSHVGRFTNSAAVWPRGKLAMATGSYMGGGVWKGRKPRAFAMAPQSLLRAIAGAVEDGTVWEHIRRAVAPAASVTGSRSGARRTTRRAKR